MAQLSGVTVAILATDGVEESEIVEVLRALQDAGAKVDVVAPQPGQIQAMRHNEKGIFIDVDRTLDSAQPGEYEALYLPGGALNADKLRMNVAAQAFARAMQLSGKPIAAICHGPWLLVSANLVRGRTLTSYYTIQDDIRNAGGIWIDQEVVEDANWITSRGPDDLPAFIRTILRRFAAEAPVEMPVLA